SLASLIKRYKSRCGMVDMELCASSFVFSAGESTSPRGFAQRFAGPVFYLQQITLYCKVTQHSFAGNRRTRWKKSGGTSLYSSTTLALRTTPVPTDLHSLQA